MVRRGKMRLIRVQLMDKKTNQILVSLLSSKTHSCIFLSNFNKGFGIFNY